MVNNSSISSLIALSSGFAEKGCRYANILDLFRGRILGGFAVSGSGAGVAPGGICQALLSGLTVAGTIGSSLVMVIGRACGDLVMPEGYANCWFYRDSVG